MDFRLSAAPEDVLARPEALLNGEAHQAHETAVHDAPPVDVAARRAVQYGRRVAARELGRAELLREHTLQIRLCDVPARGACAGGALGGVLGGERAGKALASYKYPPLPPIPSPPMSYERPASHPLPVSLLQPPCPAHAQDKGQHLCAQEAGRSYAPPFLLLVELVEGARQHIRLEHGSPQRAVPASVEAVEYMSSGSRQAVEDP